jgi:hypothetical protein
MSPQQQAATATPRIAQPCACERLARVLGCVCAAAGWLRRPAYLLNIGVGYDDPYAHPITAQLSRQLLALHASDLMARGTRLGWHSRVKEVVQ